MVPRAVRDVRGTGVRRTEGVLEPGDKLAAEDTAEHFDGKKERSARGDPAGVIRSETAGGHHAVDMGMMLQSLVPGMEHAEEADLGSEVAWIAGDLQQGLSTGVKQQVVDQPFVLQRERSQFPRQREDDVHVAAGSNSRSRAWSQRRRALP